MSGHIIREVPYRVDIPRPPSDALDVLVDLDALDIESIGDGLAAILPDGVTQQALADTLRGATVIVSEAVGRDNDSVWLVSPRAVRLGSILVTSPDASAPVDALRLTDSPAFGSGHHPTTVLCVEALEESLTVQGVQSVLDVGTGSGILALVALRLGVPHAVGLDIDAEALKVAAVNARLNHVEARLRLVHGGPVAVEGNWPLVVANVLAAPLIEMAPVLVRRLGTGGQLILSGISCSLESEVRQAYQHLGLRNFASRRRSGWTALTAQASW